MLLNELKYYTNQQITEMVDTTVHSERNRMILKRKLCDGISYESVAEEFGMSPRQIKRIVKSWHGK